VSRLVSLDSSFLIDLLSGKPVAVLKARELDAAGEPRFLTAPAAAEVLLGGYFLGGPYHSRTKSLVDSLTILPLDRESAHEAGRLGAELARRGTPMGGADLFVAAITMRHGERLLTRDSSFRRVPGLSVESY
jgi:tRNA(fMet)-specific endonuclease VapC